METAQFAQLASKRQNRQLEAIEKLHESCGHRSVKRLIHLKRLGRIKAANLPSYFLREFKKQCPTCLVTSRKRKAMPGVAADIKEKHELSKWEMAYVHCSGIFLVRSDRGYHFVASSLTEQMESNP